MNEKITFPVKSFLSLVIGLSIILSCANENKDWEKVKSSNTVESYEEFIKEYPNSSLLDSANIYIELIYFSQAKKKNTIEGFENFISRYPESKLIKSAEVILDSLRFSEVANSGNTAALEEYINKYHDSEYIQDIEVILDSLRYEKAKSEATLESYLDFAKKYPKSAFIKKVNAKIDYLKKEQLKIGIWMGWKIYLNNIQKEDNVIWGFPHSGQKYSPEKENHIFLFLKTTIKNITSKSSRISFKSGAIFIKDHMGHSYNLSGLKVGDGFMLAPPYLPSKEYIITDRGNYEQGVSGHSVFYEPFPNRWSIELAPSVNLDIDFIFVCPAELKEFLLQFGGDTGFSKQLQIK